MLKLNAPFTLALVLLAITASASAGPAHVDTLASDDGRQKPDFYRAQIMAFPNDFVAPTESRNARKAWGALGAAGSAGARDWKLVAPDNNKVDPLTTYTGRATAVAGRVTALALTPGCQSDNAGDCRLFMGAAGGGIWVAEGPFDDTPSWKSSSAGMASSAIGSIAIDPRGKGRVIYVGTGEQNLSGDSEAGVGLYKSSDGGKTWQLLPASVPFAEGLSIASIAIDPRDSRHIYFGTITGLHGSAASASASVPPGTPALGAFESRDGGITFRRILEAPTAYGPFYGGVLQVALDPNDAGTVYVGALGVGLLRSSPAIDGDGAFRLVFATGQPNDAFNRPAFALADRGRGKTRIYLGDSIDATGESMLYRVDDARVPSAQLFNGSTNAGWTSLSSAVNGTPGFASYGFCQGQCFYDIFVASPPGQPDTVWIGGSMNYDEIFGYVPPRSNGRAVMRSKDAGVHFADMTRDNRTPSEGMHPDQHAIVFSAHRPEVAIIGSDGGVVRTDGRYVDASSSCATRGLAGGDLADCQTWLAGIPWRIDNLNVGLTTLQFQSVSLNPHDPNGEWMGGTQDNGTWSYGTKGNKWFETIGGDGGQSGFDAVNTDIRVHSYYSSSMDVNFRGSSPSGWNWISDPLFASGEASAFYVPMITDPLLGGSIFVGLQHVFRTQDNGGSQAYLEQHCNEYSGDFLSPCGDWQPLGADLTSTLFGTDDRSGRWVVAVTRSTADRGTLWAATFRGRLFVTHNADAANPSAVAFQRVDSAATPRRVPSDIVVDPVDGGHAWVAYSGYGAYTPSTPGHVFELRVTPSGVTSADISYNIGDMPVTSLARDDASGDLYAATDFGVLRLPVGQAAWVMVGTALPPVAVYHLTLSQTGRVLYAATHGRSVWSLDLR
jgi:hypothetical protein